MRDYIILNNKNSNEIKGLLIQNLPPITKPRIRAEIEEIDGRDGDIVTPLGYGAYDKAFSIGLYGDFDINEVIKYFDSEGIVVFSNEPNKYYNYKILEQIDFEKLIRFRTADVMMHVQPFKYSTTEGKETEEMETKTASGSEIDLPDTNNEKLQMEKLKGDTHQDTIDAEEGNENEDTNLAVNDVDPSKENYITLKGNTTQYNHDSVNMLPNDMATLSLYGITITKNDDGTYTINGTTTQDFNWAINDTALNLQANTNYFLSGCATGGDVETYCLYISAYADTGNGVLINSSRAINDQVRIFIASGQTFNNAIFKPMLIEGTEAIPFEPYGMTTPSPQYPSEVKVVKGENVVSVQGKNLVDIEGIELNPINIQNYEQENNYIKVTTKAVEWANITFRIFLEAGTYYYKHYAFLDSEKINTSGIGSLRISSSGGTTIVNQAVAGEYLDKINDITFTIEERGIYTFVYRCANGKANVRILNINDIILSKTATDFVPYSKTDYPLSLGTLELCKIGDYKDYLFKRNGKWYVHKEIEKVILDGTENWPRTNAKNNHWRFRTFKYGNIADIMECYSNNFKYNGDTWSYEGINTVKSAIWIRNDELFTTESDLKTWLSTHNTIVYYILATPTDTEITDTTLIAQLDNLHTAELQETSYINSTPAKEYPYINLKYNVVTPAPSPDRTSEINKVTGENVVSVSGKNLFNYTRTEKTITKNGVTSTINDDGSITLNGTATGVTWFILNSAFDWENGDYTMYLNNEEIQGLIFYSDVGNARTIRSINVPSPITKDVSLRIAGGTFLNNVTIYPMILKGIYTLETIGEYQPYSKTDYPIPLGNIELCKIGDYKDYLFKRNGKWYKYKAIGKVVFNGSEEKWFQSGNYFRIQISNSKSGTNCRSNYFVAGNQDNQFFVYADNYLGFRYGVLNNILADWKTWLSTHNTIVYYALTTPTEEEITDETLLAQLEALDNIYNQKGTTYIKTNPEANNMPLSLDVSYTESRPITITNSGNIYSKPIFTIYGEGNIGVYLNDIQLFSINLGSEEQITIDVAEMQAYNKETKALKNRLVTGNYDNFVLKVGENKISFSGIVKKFEIENYSRWI